MRTQRLTAIGCALLWSASLSAQTRTVAPETGIVTWETQAHGVTLLMAQILPDQARAFYGNRGLPTAATEAYAKACVFMTVLRNDSAPGAVHFRQADWSVVTASGEQPPIVAAEWLKRFESDQLTQSARIAFRWAQFPPEQTYQPGGDWNQGMLTAGLPPGSKFDLIARWDIDGKPFEGRLKDVQCAK
ncbi:MAG: hypothetical protein KZQ93_03785 [Candidatus Thiodiazotropha sp. (ex Monitilora ramsayi)]|nr:hypothetical protein [Candidatus Thiodiazotropha sp. (ex Monitilora ramsayi)]